MVLKVSFTEIVVTIVTMPSGESITYHTLAYWLVIVEILPGFRFLLLFFPQITLALAKNLINKYNLALRKSCISIAGSYYPQTVQLLSIRNLVI
jgi:hypothetical protein